VLCAASDCSLLHAAAATVSGPAATVRMQQVNLVSDVSKVKQPSPTYTTLSYSRFGRGFLQETYDTMVVPGDTVTPSGIEEQTCSTEQGGCSSVP
jgi:hypothetical protein